MNNRLQEIRAAQGVTRQELTRRAGVANGIIYNIECYPTYAPFHSTRSKIAAALGVTPEEIWPGEVNRHIDRGIPRNPNKLAYHRMDYYRYIADIRVGDRVRVCAPSDPDVVKRYGYVVETTLNWFRIQFSPGYYECYSWMDVRQVIHKEAHNGNPH